MFLNVLYFWKISKNMENIQIISCFKLPKDDGLKTHLHFNHPLSTVAKISKFSTHHSVIIHFILIFTIFSFPLSLFRVYFLSLHSKLHATSLLLQEQEERAQREIALEYESGSQGLNAGFKHSIQTGIASWNWIWDQLFTNYILQIGKVDPNILYQGLWYPFRKLPMFWPSAESKPRFGELPTPTKGPMSLQPKKILKETQKN